MNVLFLEEVDFSILKFEKCSLSWVLHLIFSSSWREYSIVSFGGRPCILMQQVLLLQHSCVTSWLGVLWDSEGRLLELVAVGVANMNVVVCLTSGRARCQEILLMLLIVFFTGVSWIRLVNRWRRSCHQWVEMAISPILSSSLLLILLIMLLDRGWLSHVLLAHTLSMGVTAGAGATLLAIRGCCRGSFRRFGWHHHLGGVHLRSLFLLRGIDSSIQVVLVRVCRLVHALLKWLLLGLSEAIVGAISFDHTLRSKDFFHYLLLVLIGDRSLESVFDFSAVFAWALVRGTPICN